MQLSEALAFYCQYGRHELNHSQATYHVYTGRLKQFARWLTANGHGDPPVEDLSLPLIRRYHFSVASSGIRPRTLRSHIHALRSFLGYLVAQGALAENLATKIPMPKLDAAQRVILADEDVVRLLEATDRQKSDFRCVRDRAVLSVLAFCGIRRRELLDLQVDDVSLPEKILTVRKGKGGRGRMVPLCPEVLSALRDWLALRQTLHLKHNALFSIPGGRRLGVKALAQLMSTAKATAGLKDSRQMTPHCLRHSCATRLLKNGMDIKSVSVWLGHSELRTTSVYLHADEQQLRSLAHLAGFKPKEETPPPSAKNISNSDSQLRRHRICRRASR